MKNLILGISLVLTLSLGAIFISDEISQFVKFEALTVGIILGILTKSLLKDLSNYNKVINFSAKKLLKFGIVLLGFKVNFNTLLQLGLPSVLGVAIFILVVLTLSKYLGQRMGVNTKVATLIGVGSSICGASAIVTIAPVIQAEEDEAVLAVSIVSFLGTIGVLVYSAIALMPWLSDMEYGIFQA